MHIDQIIDSIYPLPEASKKTLRQHISEVSLSKGYLLMHADKVETSTYFIRKGLVRAYADSADKEITFWFGCEGDAIISMRSYIENQKGYEHLELLEACILYKLPILSLQSVFLEDIHIANWGRKLAEKELIKTEERLISRQVRTASERYRELLKNYPYLIRRVPLRHIASYLGITQVSLSRIRAEIQ